MVSRRIEIEADTNVSGAVSGIEKLVTSLEKLETAYPDAARQASDFGDRVTRSNTTAANSFGAFDRAKRNVDNLRASYDPVYAASKRYEQGVRQLNEAVGLGAISTQRYERTLEELGQAYMRATGQSRAFSGAARAMNANTTNLMFQWQDIGMMMASGQSPFLLAAQQGTQVAGIFEQMRQKGQSATQGMVAAFSSLLSPMSLVTVAGVGIVAALGQWAMKTIQTRREASRAGATLVNFAEAASTARDEIRDLSDNLDLMNRGLEHTSELGLVRSIEQQEAALQRINERLEERTAEAIRMRPEYLRQQAAAERQLEITRDLLDNLRSVREEESYRTRQAERAIQLEELREAAARRYAARVRESWRNEQEVLGSMEERLRLQRLINRYGEDSLIVVIERARQEARARDLVGEAADQYVQLALQLHNAVQSGEQLSRMDLSSPILRAATAAGQLAESLGISVSAASRLMAMGGGGSDEVIYDPRDPRYDPNRASMAGIRADTQYGLETPSTGGGGGGGGGNDFASRISSLLNSLRTEREILQSWYNESLTMLQEANASELEEIGGSQQARLRLEEEYHRRVMSMRQRERSQTLSNYSTLFGNMATIFEAGGRRMVGITRAFSVAQGAINAYRAYTEVLADPSLIGRPVMRQMLAASTLAAGLAQVAQMNSVSYGNSGGGAASVATPTAGSIPEQETRPRLMRSLTIIGESISRSQAIQIGEWMNEGTDDGFVVRGSR